MIYTIFYAQSTQQITTYKINRKKSPGNGMDKQAKIIEHETTPSPQHLTPTLCEPSFAG